MLLFYDETLNYMFYVEMENIIKQVTHCMLVSELGFADITGNSLDATGDRDFVGEGILLHIHLCLRQQSENIPQNMSLHNAENIKQ